MTPPKLCQTKTGIYYVYVNRKKTYLGKCSKRVAETRYRNFLSKLYSSDNASVVLDSKDGVTISELVAAFMTSRQTYYARYGSQYKQLDRFKTALSFPVALFPELPVDAFGPAKLVAVRESMIDSGRFCRGYINSLVTCVRHVFAWGVEQELVKPETLYGLRAVSPLKRGRSTARESSRVVPVSAEAVETTLPFLSPTVAAIVTVQRFTGMRPSEVLTMRVRDLEPWESGYKYTLEHDKTDYRRAVDDQRVVYLGTKAAAACRPFLKNKKPDSFVFIASGDNEPYKPTSYGRAITRAAKRAGVSHWTPYQLRHLFATEVRAQFGLEAAQVILGHKRADVTQIYAERNLSLARDVINKLG